MDEIVNMMKEQNLYPDSISYSAMLEANRKTKNISKSLLILKEMFQISHMEPKSLHYNILMKTFKESVSPYLSVSSFSSYFFIVLFSLFFFFLIDFSV